MGEPTRAEIEDFIRANDVDDRAAADLRDCAAEIQRKVLARGELSSARNPSAALLARIRDARMSGAGISSGGGGGGPRASGEVEDFIKDNDVDESAADSLRSTSPTIQRAVLARGELKNARNPSSALLARIRDAKSGGGSMGPVGTSAPPAAPPPMSYGDMMGAAGYGSYPGYGAPPPGAYGAMYPGAPQSGGYPGYPMYPGAGMYPGYGSGFASSQGTGGCGGGFSGGFAGGYGGYGGYGYGSFPMGGGQQPPPQAQGDAGGKDQQQGRPRSRSRSSSSGSRSRSRGRRGGGRARRR